MKEEEPVFPLAHIHIKLIHVSILSAAPKGLLRLLVHMERLSPKETQPFAEGHTVSGERRWGWGLNHGRAASPQVTWQKGHSVPWMLFCTVPGGPLSGEAGQVRLHQRIDPVALLSLPTGCTLRTRPGSPPASILFPSAHSYHGSWAHTSFRVRPM